MYENLNDFVEINGLQSITVLFNVVSKYRNGKWQTIKTGQGFKLLTKLRSNKHAILAEANSTRWRNQTELLLDTNYAAQFKNLQIKDPISVRQIIALTAEIRQRYKESQIFINDFYEVDNRSDGLETYIQHLDQVH